MNMNEQASEKSEGIVEAVAGAAYEVGNTLGAGFLEKVYERALARELTLRGLQVKTQVRFPVRYKGLNVGDYYADLVVGEGGNCGVEVRRGFFTRTFGAVH